MHPVNRRQFLGTVAAGAAAVSPLQSLVAQVPAPGSSGTPSKTVRLGLIGSGWWGMLDTRAAFKAGGVEVLAICDVDSDHLEKSAVEIEKLQGRRPRTFKHYADLLEVPGLEAIILATPPQWHALPFIAALEKGLHIYLEKPVSYDVREGRAMVTAAAKRPNQVVQVGFQRRQSAAFKAVKQFIADGHIGRVVQAEAQINFSAGLKSPVPEAPPATLDWDLWCGPAPLIPYSPEVGHMSWRLEETTGQGHLYDWGIHLIDAARVILGTTSPRTISAAGGLYRLKGRITTPDTMTAHFEYDRCPISWRHRIWGAEEYTPEINNGVSFFGETGTVWVSDNKWVHIPKVKGAERKVTEIRTDTSVLHMTEFLEAVRGNGKASCTLADAHLSTTAVKLAMIALKSGARLTWDAEREQIVGNPEAAKLLRREYRAPWKHP